MNRTEHEGEFEIGRMSERERGIDYSRATGGPDEGGHRDSIFQTNQNNGRRQVLIGGANASQKADRSGQPTEVSALGHRAADWLERSADYLSEMEPQRLKSDIENQVRRNPGRSLLIAGIVGLALGGLLRRR